MSRYGHADESAERHETEEAVTSVRQAAAVCNVSPEAAGIIAGFWYASPATHVGHELIAAGMMILAGGGRGVPLDYGELERWTRVGYERGTAMRPGER
jgi:hypothetical protein